MLRHKHLAHSDMDSDEDVSVDRDIFGPIDDNESSHSDSDDDTSVTSEEPLEIDPWRYIVEQAYQKCQSEYESTVNELMEKDAYISESEAKENAFRSMKSTYRRAIMNCLAKELIWFDSMKNDPIYKSIKKTISHLIDTDGYDKDEAFKYGILKRQFLFDKVLEPYQIPKLEKEDAMEQDDESE